MMIHKVVACCCLVLATTARAQSWCPPGATWTYDSNGMVALRNGYTVMTYTHDTVLAGAIGQVIGSMTVGLNIAQEVDTLTTPVHVITRHEGELVHVWSYEQQTWDTLYNFAAVPGESWQPPFAQPGLCGGDQYGDAVQVLDTGTAVVNGLALRYLDIRNGLYEGRIIERLGWSVAMYIFQGCWQLECVCDLRCYHDDEIAYMRPNLSIACDSVTGTITDAKGPEPPSTGVFPNPGSGHFTVNLPPGPHTIEVFDATGRRMLQQRTTKDFPVIGTQDLPPGLFLVRVTGPMGIATTHRWTKQ